jgi:hypothetical protein
VYSYKVLCAAAVQPAILTNKNMPGAEYIYQESTKLIELAVRCICIWCENAWSLCAANRTRRYMPFWSSSMACFSTQSPTQRIGGVGEEMIIHIYIYINPSWRDLIMHTWCIHTIWYCSRLWYKPKSKRSAINTTVVHATQVKRKVFGVSSSRDSALHLLLREWVTAAHVAAS